MPVKTDIAQEVIVEVGQCLALATGCFGGKGRLQEVPQAGDLDPAKGGQRQVGAGVHGKSFQVSSGTVMLREGCINSLDPYAAPRHIMETNACDHHHQGT
jgi:hypothetical protein